MELPIIKGQRDQTEVIQYSVMARKLNVSVFLGCSQVIVLTLRCVYLYIHIHAHMKIIQRCGSLNFFLALKIGESQKKSCGNCQH